MPLYDLILLALKIACVALAVWALVDCATRKTEAFPAASKQTKQFWLIILGLSIAVELLFGIVSLFGLPAVAATIVYLVDVRPKVREIGSGSPW